MKERTLVCRCEDITESEVIQAIRDGATSMEELKRVLRVGMGPCQGRTCGPMIQAILARELERPPQSFESWNTRPPLKPVPASAFFSGEKR